MMSGAPQAPTAPRIGLVLGGGGLVGQAYQAGVLAALEHDLGWDSRGAEVIVGTSAGALTGIALRMGIPATGLAAWAVDAPLWGEIQAFADSAGKFPALSSVRWSDLLIPRRLPGPHLLTRAVRAPWRIRPPSVALTLARDGRLRIDEELPLLGSLPEEWPTKKFRVCAVRRRDGARVVFGTGEGATPPVTAAVAASCAVPGYFAPVVIDGVSYLDGGVHSSTNADVLRDEELDLVIVVAPMSGTPGRRPSVAEVVRRSTRARLRSELRQLGRHAPRTLVIEPGPAVLDLIGSDFMDGGVAFSTVAAAFVEAGEQVQQARGDVRALLRDVSACR